MRKARAREPDRWSSVEHLRLAGGQARRRPCLRFSRTRSPCSPGMRTSAASPPRSPSCRPAPGNRRSSPEGTSPYLSGAFLRDGKKVVFTAGGRTDPFMSTSRRPGRQAGTVPTRADDPDGGDQPGVAGREVPPRTPAWRGGPDRVDGSGRIGCFRAWTRGRPDPAVEPGFSASLHVAAGRAAPKVWLYDIGRGSVSSGRSFRSKPRSRPFAFG